MSAANPRTRICVPLWPLPRPLALDCQRTLYHLVCAMKENLPVFFTPTHMDMNIIKKNQNEDISIMVCFICPYFDNFVNFDNICLIIITRNFLWTISMLKA